MQLSLRQSWGQIVIEGPRRANSYEPSMLLHGVLRSNSIVMSAGLSTAVVYTVR